MAQPLLKVVQLLDDVVVGQALHRRVLRPAPAVRQMAEPARAGHVGLAVRDDVGHRRMVLREPVGRAVVVADLLLRELELRTLGLPENGRRRVGGGRRRRREGRGALRRRLRGHDTGRQLRLGVGPGGRHLSLAVQRVSHPHTKDGSDSDSNDACPHSLAPLLTIHCPRCRNNAHTVHLVRSRGKQFGRVGQSGRQMGLS